MDAVAVADDPRTLLDMADIFRCHIQTYAEAYPLSLAQWKVVNNMCNCRTAILGGHLDRCDDCGTDYITYNSCRDRHCPKCQGSARERWLAARVAELLPVHYFHTIFTMPGTIAPLALQNKKVLYDILFDASGRALLEVGANPEHLGAELGYLGILHSWGQNLEFHPHIHYIIPGGGLSFDGMRWIPARKKFLLSVRVLSKRFRTLFTEALQEAFDKGELEFHGQLAHLQKPATFHSWLKSTRAKDWVVHSKTSAGGPEQTLQYLGRYAYRVAISNHRLKKITDTHVTFEWKDYRTGRNHLLMTLHVHEFMRRFLMHVLPPRFVRIRFGGFLAHHHKAAKLALCREFINQQSTNSDTSVTEPAPELAHQPQPAVPANSTENQSGEEKAKKTSRKCPSCTTGHLRCVSTIPSQLPPRRRRRRRRTRTGTHPPLRMAA